MVHYEISEELRAELKIKDKLRKEQDKLDKEKNREYYPFDEYDDPELIPAIEAGDDDNRDETESQ